MYRLDNIEVFQYIIEYTSAERILEISMPILEVPVSLIVSTFIGGHIQDHQHVLHTKDCIKEYSILETA